MFYVILVCYIVLSSTGCSLNIVFFQKMLEYSGLWPFSTFPLCQCVYTQQAGRKPALQQNWQSSEKSLFKEKTPYLMKTLYLYLYLYPVPESQSYSILVNQTISCITKKKLCK